LHSALIDELTERHPEPKPELGMPQRQRELALPVPGLTGALICETSFALEAGGETRGFALFAADAEAASKLGLDSRALWEALIKRAGREFMFRGIKPRLGDVRVLEGPGLPAGYAAPGRVVWIPFKLNPGVCWLGVGA
jgi:hypothetical protein